MFFEQFCLLYAPAAFEETSFLFEKDNFVATKPSVHFSLQNSPRVVPYLLESSKNVSKISFLGVGKNFRLLMQSCCFFFSRPFHENFKFLKNCPYDFHEILHSHSTPKGAPACAKASKSYGLDVRNIAKISPKVAKKQPFFDFLRFSQKLSIRFERNFLQLFYTIFESYMCNGIKIVWLGCEKHSQN